MNASKENKSLVLVPTLGSSKSWTLYGLPCWEEKVEANSLDVKSKLCPLEAGTGPPRQKTGFESGFFLPESWF